MRVRSAALLDRRGLRLVLALVPAALVAAGAVLVDARLGAERRLEMLEDRALAAANLLDQRLAARFDALRFCAASPHLVHKVDLAAFREECGRLHDVIGSWIVLIELGPIHRQIVNSRVPDGQPLPPPYPRAEERPTLLELEARSRGDGQTGVSDAFPGRALDALVTTAGRFVTLADGREAMLYSSFAVSELSVLLASLANGDEAAAGAVFLGLFDGSLHAIARSSRGEERLGTAAPPWFRDAAASSHGRLSRVPGPLPGDPTLDIAFRRLDLAGDWVVFAGAWRPAHPFSVEDLPRGWRPLALALAAGLLSATALQLWSRAERSREQLAAAEAARAAAERADRERARVTAAMAHEIRGPLTALVGALELGRGRVSAETLESAMRSGEAVLQLVDDILELSFLGSGKLRLNPTPTDLARAVRDVAARHASRARAKGIALEVETPSATPPVEADRLRFEQVVENLVSNAVKFTPAGRVTVRLTTLSRDAGSVDVDLAVLDTGPGVPPAARETIFEEFHSEVATRAGPEKGTGLGLPIARRLARAMGGEVTVGDAPGGGAVFHLRLRLPIASPGDTSGDAAAGRPLAGVEVVLAEDEPVIREITALRLRRAGARVIEAADGAEALAAVLHRRPDLVLLDLEMPVLDGVETARRIRSRPDLRDLPVFALTSHLGGPKAAAARAAGMDEVLTKPLQTAPLAAALQARRGLSGRAHRRSDEIGDSAPAILDQAVFGGVGAIAEQLPRFEREGLARLRELAAAMEAGDRPLAAELSHRLRGVALTFGAAALAGALTDFEALLERQPLDAAAAEVEHLSDLLQRTAEAMRRSLEAARPDDGA